MPPIAHKIKSADVHAAVKSLTHNLVNIKDETGEFLLPLPNDGGRIIDTKSWDTDDWEWTHGIGLYGIWQYFELTGDVESLHLLENWFQKRLAAGGPTKNINTMSPFLTLAHLYEKTGNQTYLPWLTTWSDWVLYSLNKTRFGGFQHDTYLGPSHQQLWADTLMMSVLPLAKIGILLDRPEYVAEATHQFLIHIKYLFNPKTGFFFHGWQFNTPDTGNGSSIGGHNFACAPWARGNSWITIAIPEFISLLKLPPGDPVREHLIDTLEAQCAALKACQAMSGLWCTLLDEGEEAGSYVEASATAGFAYGMLRAMRERYISREIYEETAVKAVKAVLENVSSEGELLRVSFGTGMGGDRQFYKDIRRTSMPYGQAMGMMALTEFLREFI